MKPLTLLSLMVIACVSLSFFCDIMRELDRQREEAEKNRIWTAEEVDRAESAGRSPMVIVYQNYMDDLFFYNHGWLEFAGGLWRPNVDPEIANIAGTQAAYGYRCLAYDALNVAYAHGWYWTLCGHEPKAAG